MSAIAAHPVHVEINLSTRRFGDLIQPRPVFTVPSKESTYIADRFGVRVRGLRLHHGMTQLEMAVAFGIDRSFISDVERGKKVISLTLMEVMALGFGISLSDLLSNV